MTQASYLGKKKVSVKVHLLNAAFALLVWKQKTPSLRGCPNVAFEVVQRSYDSW